MINMFTASRLEDKMGSIVVWLRRVLRTLKLFLYVAHKLIDHIYKNNFLCKQKSKQTAFHCYFIDILNALENFFCPSHKHSRWKGKVGKVHKHSNKCPCVYIRDEHYKLAN